MSRYFNTEGCCNPQNHYMVKLNDRLKRIKEEYVDEGKYFVINRGRQYGKTTTLMALEEYLKDDYIVLSLGFQKIGIENFVDSATFVCAFAKKLSTAFQKVEVEDKETLQRMLLEFRNDIDDAGMYDLFECLNSMCEISSRPIVLMIDEADSVSDSQVFIDFLSQLRSYYLKRDEMPTFHSVILAGIYNIINPELKQRPESEHRYNSPWNIAADFDVDMSFSPDQIAGMLEEYESDYYTGMDIQAVSKEIYDYTSGYPVLVSLICKRIDEEIMGEGGSDIPQRVWSHEGIEKAVKSILMEQAPLFESMVRHLDEYPGMKKMFHAILFQGSEFSYSPDTKEISLACMFGYAVNVGGKVRIANRIFEMRLYNYFISEEELTSTMGKMAQRDKSYFIHDGRLDMDTALKKFVDYCGQGSWEKSWGWDI